jgi:hypothetical protein
MIERDWLDIRSEAFIDKELVPMTEQQVLEEERECRMVARRDDLYLVKVWDKPLRSQLTSHLR